jgi:hypothetical protein
MSEAQSLPAGSPLARELEDVLERGDIAALDRLLEKNPGAI